MEKVEKYYNIKQASAATGIPYRELRQLIDENRLKVIRINRVFRIKEEWLNEIISDNEFHGGHALKNISKGYYGSTEIGKELKKRLKERKHA